MVVNELRARLLSHWLPFKESSDERRPILVSGETLRLGMGSAPYLGGWLVLAAFVALIAAGAWLFPPRAMFGFFLAYVLILAALLLGVCWLTGEPPRWRWGDDRRA